MLLLSLTPYYKYHNSASMVPFSDCNMQLGIILHRAKTFTALATPPKGGAATQNLRILIFTLKTIVFPTSKTQFRLLSELEAHLLCLLPPFFHDRSLGKRGPSLSQCVARFLAL